MSEKYAVIFEQAESNWAVYVPIFPAASQPERPSKRRSEIFGKRSKATSGRFASLASPSPVPPASPERSKSRQPHSV